MNMLGLSSSVRIAHVAEVYMVMGNAFSSREAVSPIKVINWEEEPLMGFEQSHFVSLAAV
jgi:hypothetical protein